MPGKLLSVAIPFFNEEENVEKCILDHVKSLEEAGINFEIIAVDNGSSDKTGEILQRLKSKKVRLARVEKNQGFGNGILKGWSVAKGSYLAYNCGDNEVDAAAVAIAFKKLLAENLDMCKGKRINREYSFSRKMQSFVYNKVFCPLVLGYWLGDVNGYPKVLTRQCFNRIRPSYKDSFFDTEMMVKAVRKGCKIGDITVSYRKRKKGRSTVKFYIALEFLKNLAKLKKDLLLGKA